MQKLRKIVAVMAIVSLVAVNGYVSTANAASMTNASDKVSDSDISVSATHTVTFTNTVTVVANGYFEVVFPQSIFGPMASTTITCPAGMTNSTPNAYTARCTSNAGTATGTHAIIIANLGNPATTGSQLITINHKNNSNALQESTTVMIAIVDNVDVSATVASTLTFEIRPLPATTTINGINTTAGSATTSLSFGTLTVGTSSVMGQELHVTTNADNGYTVTVEQDQDLTSAGGSTIDAFKDGATSSPQTWAAPAGTLDSVNTYGHFGFTTDDATGNGSVVQDYTGGKWRGLNNNVPVPVMYHNGPADGQAQDKGMAKVAYRIQISALQEAGDYTNTLTYIATPVY